MEKLNPSDAVILLSELTGQTFQMVGRLPGGESGAHEVRGPDGTRWVAKWDLNPGSQARAPGAPSLSRPGFETKPGGQFLTNGVSNPRRACSYSRSCFPGSPFELFSQELVAQLLTLHERRIGLAQPEDASKWPYSLIETLLRGGENYCLHSSLRTYDVRTAKLLDRIIEIGRERAGERPPGHRHRALGPARGQSAPGRWTFDAALWITTSSRWVTLRSTWPHWPPRHVTPSVSRACVSSSSSVAVEPLDEARRSAYFGHLLLRVLDWAIRYDRRDEVDLWLAQSARLLPG